MTFFLEIALIGNYPTNFWYEYHSDITTGQIVEVPIINKITIGIVLKSTTKKPNFPTKKIIKIHSNKFATLWLDYLRWVGNYYYTPLPKVLKNALPKEATTQIKKPIKNDLSANDIDNEKLYAPSLNAEQNTIVQNISSDIGQKFQSHLIYGITGSGKTRIYLELIIQALSYNIEGLYA